MNLKIKTMRREAYKMFRDKEYGCIKVVLKPAGVSRYTRARDGISERLSTP